MSGAKISNIVRNPSNNIKQDYVVFVGDSYLLINESFNNKSRIIKDYGDVVFDDSYVVTNTTLPFAKSAKEVYLITAVLDTNYSTINNTVTYVTELNSNPSYLKVVLDAVVSGNTILSYDVRSVEVPQQP